MKVKKAKITKLCVITSKLTLEDLKNFLEATQLENDINQLEKNKLDVDYLREKN